MSVCPTAHGVRALVEPLESRQLLATNGLSAVYFNNRDFTGSARTRLDPMVAFDWPNHSSPAKGIKGTTFSARWTGLIKPYTNETYTFTTRSNDGIRLWVNGKLLIDHWSASKRHTQTGTMSLKANRLYDIRLEYYDTSRTAAITLFWSSPSRGQTRVATSRLFAYDTRAASLGDYGWNNSGEAGVAKLIRSWKPQFITTVGDNNYPDGGADTIDDNVGQYFHDYIGNYHGDYGSGADDNLFFPALGNHDWKASNATPYKNYFTLPGNERYYDFVRGPIHFFVLDSDESEPDGTSPDSKQGQWLKGKLADSDSPFNLVVFHHSPFSSGSEGSTDRMAWPFYEWGADLVLSGHSHEYERLSFAIPYVVNGAGGKPLPFSDDRLDNTVVRDDADAGALLIQANEYALTLQYQRKSGKIVDTLTIGPTPTP